MDLRAISPVLAELSIPPGPNAFGVRSSGIAPVHDVGLYGAPRWRFHQTMSPDEGWAMETLPGGRLLSAPSALPESLEWAYLQWAEGSRAESGAGILQALPPGEYLLARSNLEARRAPQVLLGNERIPSPANTLVVLDRQPFFSMLIGPDGGAPPRTTHPLIGLVALNYVGESHWTGALFFDSLTPEEAPRREGDLVLVIPRTGELVIDALASFSSEAHRTRDQATWRDTGARQLAKVLTGM
ncbi:hypothetical protein LZC95_51120 [Pendulispora brunnea]|uniref:Uncharacterized protein n=1 Tax=Pendulispora brunnea TaxID=2905690 RepID=A0ABZ2KEH5_9BACT